MNFIRQWVTRPLRWLLLAALLPLALLAVLLLGLDAPPGKRLLERLAASLTGDGPVRVEITGLSGHLPFSPRLERLRLADADGVWLEAEGLALDINPRAALDGVVHIEQLRAAALRVLRLPVSPPAAPAGAAEPAPPDDSGPGPPGALRLIQLDVLELDGLNAAGNRLSGGGLTLYPDDLTLDGALTLELADPGALAVLVDQTAAGRLSLGVHLRSRRDGAGGQEADASLSGEGLAVAGTALGTATAALGLERRLTPDGERWSASDVQVDAAGLSLRGAAALTGETLSGALRLERLELRRLAGFAPLLATAAGSLTAEARLSGDLAAPAAQFSADLAGFALPELGGAGVKPLDARLEGKYDNGDVTAQVRAGDGSGLLGLTGRATLRNGGATLDAAADGFADLRLLDDALSALGDAAAGRVNFNLTAAGSLAAPQLRGTVSMRDGTYRQQASGLRLSDIALSLGVTPEAVRIERLTAKAGNGGTLSLTGQTALTPAVQADLRLRAVNALLADTAMASVVADADLTLRGGPGGARLAGDVTLNRTDIRIPRRMPADIPTLEVVEVGRGRKTVKVAPAPAGAAPPARPVKAGVEAEGAAAVALEVGVTAAPRRVVVDGQGFHGEFGGRVTVTGTAAAPAIAGRFDLQRGTLKALGRTFNFTRGQLLFDGGSEIDPRLDVVAETRAGTDTARIKVGGSPRRPDISFESANGLPADEVAAQILFGKTTDRLSPGQAVELASAVAALGGFDAPASLLGDIKAKLGLDRLESGADAAGRPTLDAGRYVRDGVYIGVRQGAKGPQGRVEVDLTDHINIEAGVGPGGAPEIGVGIEFDY